jgi:uncharacterized small protein (DUF1192 family)
MGSDDLKQTRAMTIEARSDRELQLASQVDELKREVAELREALARTCAGHVQQSNSRARLASPARAPRNP